MTPLGKQSQHQQLFLTLAAFGAATIALCGYAVAGLHAALGPAELDRAKAAVVAAITFTLFYQFYPLLSTRTIGYMLVRASLCWMRVVVLTLLAYVLLLPEANRSQMFETMRWWAIGTWPVILCATVLMRLTAEKVYSGGAHARQAVFVLPGQQARLLNLRLQRSPTLGFRVKGYFGPEGVLNSAAMPRLGAVEDVEAYMRSSEPHVIFIGTDLTTTPPLESLMKRLSDSTAAVYFIPEYGPNNYFQFDSASIADVPVLSLHETNILGMARVLKRGTDIMFSSMFLLAFSIPMLLIAWAVRKSSPGPVFFKQVRYGQDGKPIHILKFRSMRVHQPDGKDLRQATKGDARVTPIGGVLRRTSLDELPQFLNVLGGSMSLVGPRPHAAEHNEFYRQQIQGYMLRHTVKPGITGWAQINGLRGETDTLDKMLQRVEHDRYYIRNWTLWLDLMILVRTPLVILNDKKAY